MRPDYRPAAVTELLGVRDQPGGELITRPPPVACPSMTGAPEGAAVVLDVAQLEALLVTTFNIGLDVGRGKDKAALVRLRLSKALLGAAEAQALVLQRQILTSSSVVAGAGSCLAGSSPV
ncbi:MAG TPA: hypothetical protein VIY28_09730 [Pseudonocardiaceae bacterium]